MKCIGVMRINSSFLDTVFELLDTPNTMYQGSLTTEKRSDIQYDVEFRDVSFKYHGSEAYALRHVNNGHQHQGCFYELARSAHSCGQSS